MVVLWGERCSHEPLDISAFPSNQMRPSPHTTLIPAHNYSLPTSFFKLPLPPHIKWFVLLVQSSRRPGDTSCSSISFLFKHGNCSRSPPSVWFSKERKEKTKGMLEVGYSLGFFLVLPCSQQLWRSLTQWNCLYQVMPQRIRDP